MGWSLLSKKIKVRRMLHLLKMEDGASETRVERVALPKTIAT